MQEWKKQSENQSRGFHLAQVKMDILEKAFNVSTESTFDKKDLLLQAIMKLLDYLKMETPGKNNEEILSRFDDLEEMIKSSRPRLSPSPS